MEEGELSIACEIHFDLVEGSNGVEYVTLPESAGTINGEHMTYDEYVLWYDSMSILRTVDGTTAEASDYIGYTIGQLLQICR